MGRRPRTAADATPEAIEPTLEGTDAPTVAEAPTVVEVVEEQAPAVQFEPHVLRWAANAIDERAVSTIDLGLGDVSEARRLANHLRSIAEAA